MSEFKIGNMRVIMPPAVNMMAIVVIIGLAIVSSTLYTENTNHKKLITSLQKDWQHCDDTVKNVEAAYMSCTDRKNELLDKAWHNGPDLVDYIGTRYPKIPVEIARLIADSINSAIEEHKMDFSLVVGIMEVESRFNPMAKSKKGAAGLMQIMPNIWADSLDIENHEDFYDIETNVLCGVKVFLHNLEIANGDISEALWRYNGVNGKKGEFADLVYKMVGRFETFRAMKNGEYESDEQTKMLTD